MSVKDWTNLKLIDTLIVETLAISTGQGANRVALEVHDEIMLRLNQAQPPCSECATLRKERDEAKRIHRNYLNEWQMQYDAMTDRAEAAEAQLSTLRDALEAIKIALKEPAGGEYWTARKFLDERGIYHGDLDDLRVLNKVAEAALAPTPEVATKTCQIKGCVNKVAEMRHCTEHMPGNFPPETVAPKEGKL